MYLFRNVNDAFLGLVRLFQQREASIVEETSRVGNVLRFSEPVLVRYSHPWERVLFNEARDCNPFFHLFESLWMIAGRNDVAPLKYYVSTVGDYSDDGKTFHGAYGQRWREYGNSLLCFDQLKAAIIELRKDPGSRRVVVAMWDSLKDLGLRVVTKDKPCNTHVYFCVVDGKLQMTVCNRSNDLVWGMLGANVVHFSMLQEYMAAGIGVPMGRYYHLTNNLHAYQSRWRGKEWLQEPFVDFYSSSPYSFSTVVPLVEDHERFTDEVASFVSLIDGVFKEPFLRYVAQPMMAAFRAHKQRRYVGDLNAFTLIERVHNFDWRIAGKEWLHRRHKKWMAPGSQHVNAE